MKKTITRNDRTPDGLYKGTPFVRFLHKHLEVIWGATICLVAIILLCSVNFRNGYMEFSLLGGCAMLVVAICCMVVIFLSSYHVRRRQVANTLIAIRSAMRHYGYGDADSLFYVCPTSKEDWVTILRDSYEYAKAEVDAGVECKETKTLGIIADFAKEYLHKQYLL